MLIFNILIFILSCLVLVKSANFLIKAITKISAAFQINEFTLAFIVVTLATSIPELFIGVFSALDKIPTLSLGNVIGSNIVALSLIIGLSAVLARGIKTESRIIKDNTLYLVLISFLPLILSLDRNLSRLDGVTLIIFFLIYLFKLYRERRAFHKVVSSVTKKTVNKQILILMISLVCLLISSNFLVKSGLNITAIVGFKPIWFGILIIAIGTSLPELIFQTKAALRDHGDMALGNMMGSVVANITLILGITVLIQPIYFENFYSYILSLSFMILVVVIFDILMQTKNKLSWKEGIVLIFIYIIFVIFQLFFNVTI
ncbi:MAG: sodium:calcium antiporter [Patescibacteria group bacterium]|nr:sodium:calcium antiporter [Patescibacteria group bacterium]